MESYQWINEYLLSFPGAEADYKEEWGWERGFVGGKMFAARCCPGENHGIFAGREILTLKCEPALSEILREKYPDIVPGFYMDKRNWISIFLDGAVPEDVIKDLCKNSHTLVFSKLTKKMQREILG